MHRTPRHAASLTRHPVTPYSTGADRATDRAGLEIEAHRGDSAHAPENTLAAFRRAVALKAPWIELDVHPSRDGALMVLHDDTVDRTTNGRGAVADLAADDLRRLDAGAWFAPSFAREKIPFLSEVMDLVGPTGTRLNVEIKASPRTLSVPQTLAGLLRHHGKSPHYVVSSFDLDALLAVRAAAPEIPLALIGKGPAILALARRHRLPWIHAAHATLDAARVARAHACGIQVNAWTVDDPETAARLRAIGVDKICTNCPERLLTALPLR